MRTQLSVLLLTLLTEMTSAVTVVEVKVGETAVLPCPSDDDQHRFQYWKLDSDVIIGPGAELDKHKYKYEVWSGKLFVKGVSTTESGIYQCITKAIGGHTLKVKGVELVVKRDWEETFETDPETNTYRAVIGVLVLLTLLMAGGFFFILRRRRSNQFQEVGREDSPEESLTAEPRRGPYNVTNVLRK